MRDCTEDNWFNSNGKLGHGVNGEKCVCVRTCLSNFVRPKNWNASILEGANSPHEFESSQCGFKVRVIIMISVRVRVSLLTSLLETIASKSKWMMNG